MVVLLIAAAAIASVWSPSVPDGAPSVFAAPFGEGTSDLGTVCGRTEGTTNANDSSHTVVWTCAACLVPDQADRAFEMFEWVAVEPGSVPSWGIFADLGSRGNRPSICGVTAVGGRLWLIPDAVATPGHASDRMVPSA